VLNLYNVRWADKAINMGLAPLAASLPSLRILNAPDDVLVRPNILPRTDATSSISAAMPHVHAWHDSKKGCVICAHAEDLTDGPLQHQAMKGRLPLRGCIYELKYLPGRRLRRWPRRAALGHAAHDPVEALWPVVDQNARLWDV
jgi:hypothetical protein